MLVLVAKFVKADTMCATLCPYCFRIDISMDSSCKDLCPLCRRHGTKILAKCEKAKQTGESCCKKSCCARRLIF